MVISHRQLPEIGVLHHLPEAGNALFQDFLTMGNEKETGIPMAALIEIAIVEGGNGCFPGARGRHHQIIPAVLSQPFRAKGVQHRLLIRIGLNVKGIGSITPLLLSSPFPVDGTTQFVVIGRYEGPEFVGMPIGIKGGLHLGNDSRQVLLRHLHIPLHTIGDGGAGQIGGAYVGRRKSAVPVEHIGLRMKPGFLYIIRNPHLRIWQLRKHLHCLGVRGAHVGGGHHAKMAAAGSEPAKAGQNEGQAGKTDKRNQHIHAVTGHDFPVQLMNHGHIISGIGKKEGIHQRRGRRLPFPPGNLIGPMFQGFQDKLLCRHIMAGPQIGNTGSQPVHQLIRQRQLIIHAVVMVFVSNILQAEPNQLLQVSG